MMGNCVKLLIIFLMFHFHNSDQLNITTSSSITRNHTHHLCLPLQSLALLHFKSNFVVMDTCSLWDNPKTESWKESTDCCFEWDGVTCDAMSGHVIELDLRCSCLTGTIHHSSNSLFSSHIAPNLHKLDLSHNDFQGSNLSSLLGLFKIASSSSSLTHLNLSRSNFSGIIPSEISHLSNLVSLDLSGNNLVGSVLEMIAQNLTRLRNLNLHAVDMSSVVDLSAALKNISSSLISLNLGGCQLHGNLPSGIFLLPNLQELDLRGNNFHHITSLPKLNSTTPSNNLRFLDIAENSFSTSNGLLDLVGNFKSLRILYLSDSNLSGSIPQSFGNLSEIAVLALAGNHLSGPIPNSFSNLTQLTNLYLWGNQLEGPLDSGLFALPFLQFVYLDRNKLHGEIPRSISKCKNLVFLDLSSNNLSGSLDFNLFLNLKNLTHLDLHNNSLSSATTTDGNLSYTTLPSLGDLDLSSCNLSKFPTFVRALTNLTYFDISNNKIHGEIPKWISDVGKYSLSFIDLSHNMFQGPLPILPKTTADIDLSHNLFQGPLPIPSKTTTFFSVSNNSLVGELSSQICDVTSLTVLDLSHNHFSGLIPPCLSNFSSSISVLNLQMNDFHGFIPNTFANCSYLEYLNLNANHLEGTLPRSLANCESLQVLDVNNNMVEDVFPYWLGALSELQVLTLRSNKFYGSIGHLEHSFVNASFHSLRILDLSTNNFSGRLPTRFFSGLRGIMNLSYGEDPDYMRSSNQYYDFTVKISMKGFGYELEKILTILTTIDLSNNKFEGEIPKVVGKLSLLKGLNLSHNSFKGCIPSSIGDLVNIEWLDLSNNNLVGQIPSEFASLVSLAVFNVSNNHLHGPIPQGNQFNTFEGNSYEGNSGLCGFPLSRCGNDEMPRPPQTEDAFDSAIEFDWKIVFIGYGCGTIFGLSMGYIVFTTGSPKWFVKMVERKQYMRERKSKKKTKLRGRGRNEQANVPN